MLAASVYRMLSRLSLMGEQLRLAAEHAANAGDEGLRSQALGWYVPALMWGPADPGVFAEELDAIERDEPYPYVAAWVAVGRAELARLDTRFDDARRHIQQAIELFSAMGIHTLAAACQMQLVETELSAGEPARALPGLEEATRASPRWASAGFDPRSRRSLAGSTSGSETGRPPVPRSS
jgi:hypothetical protein